jgi:hypothetical protein
VSSPIDEPEFREELRQFVKENSRQKGEVLTLLQIRTWVGEKLQLDETKWYAENTMMRWMHQLGFHIQTQKKSLYVDGHERPDVVASRVKFMADYRKLREKCFLIDDASDSLPEVLIEISLQI